MSPQPTPPRLHPIHRPPSLKPGALASGLLALGLLSCGQGSCEGDGDPAPPTFLDPGPQTLAEDTPFSLTVLVEDADGDTPRVWAPDLPPGARWDEAARTLRFTPDFIQGGHTYPLTLVADDGLHRVTLEIPLIVEDTIHPPDPEIVADDDTGQGYRRLTLRQRTDAFLDSPTFAGRAFDAVVTAPTGAAPRSRPVRLALHGFGGSPWQSGWSGEFRIAPHDPQNTYWWGYADALPGSPSAGAAPPYTLRRAIHLVGWVLETFPAADPERVYVEGASMGGAGAALVALMHGRHVAWTQAFIGQAIPRNHRPTRVNQLSGLWGSPDANLDGGAGAGVWDAQDLTHLMATRPEARSALLYLKHGKDDPTIHFGAAVHPSPLTGEGLYDALRSQHIGHFAIWDEGAHGPADPLLGDAWWQTGWNPIFDATTQARRAQPFPAFSGASLDGDPGQGTGNGQQPWSDESGYAGTLSVIGDTGWDGEIAGALNRGLRWRSAAIVDTLDRFEIPLMALDGAGGAPPAPGYPTTGDRLNGAPPVLVDVTPRRLQAFQIAPGEAVAYTFGAQSGVVRANDWGEVTLPQLALETEWQTLVMTRVE